MSLALAFVLAAQAATAGAAPAAPAKKLVPMTFQAQADAKGGAAAKAWADELRAAVEARKDEFRAAKPGEKADVVVKVESVGPAANGATVMKGALLVGSAPHPFSLSYAGPSAPQTEKLARNLRSLAEQMKANPPPK
jgi:hypothetical protein